MPQLQLKIVQIDTAARIAVVKYATENSLLPIDDYDGVAFQLGSAQNAEQFIDSIKFQCMQYALERDYIETSIEPSYAAEWEGFETVISDDEIVLPTPTTPPEVEL